MSLEEHLMGNVCCFSQALTGAQYSSQCLRVAAKHMIFPFLPCLLCGGDMAADQNTVSCRHAARTVCCFVQGPRGRPPPLHPPLLLDYFGYALVFGVKINVELFNAEVSSLIKCAPTALHTSGWTLD